MNKNSLWAVGVGVLLALNILVIYFRFGPERGVSKLSEAGGRLKNRPQDFAVDDPRQDSLLEWHNGEPDTSSVGPFKLKMTSDCIGIADGCEKLDPMDLSADQIEDLKQAIGGLVEAYKIGTGQSIVEYMRSRKQVLDPKIMSRKRRFYVESHPDVGSDVLPNDETVFQEYWSHWEYGADWVGHLPEASCATVGRCPADRVHALAANGSLGHGEKKLWRNAKTYPHHFVPEDGHLIEDEVESHGAAVFADVMIVILHGEKVYHQRSPYFVRYWYSSSNKKWQPLLLSRCRIDQSKQDGVKILF